MNLKESIDKIILEFKKGNEMKSYSIKNINFLKIKDISAQDEISYGLSQEWYKDHIQVRAGCGATVAATILTYYNQYKNFKNLEVKDVLPVMEDLWNYLLPIKGKGLNSTKLFYDGISNYFSEQQKDVIYKHIDVIIKEKVDLMQIVNFLVEELSKDRPVAFLNLCNGKEQTLDRWHWVTVFEIFEENDNYFLNILDDKEIKKINLSLWYDTITNDGGFVSFYE